MARRPYPFYSSVGFRTANKVRNGVASWIFGKITFVYALFSAWVCVFVLLKGIEYLQIKQSEFPEFTGTPTKPGDLVTIEGYLSGTWEYIVSFFTILGKFISYLAS